MSRLGDCLSPYLLQHAGNPVDWHPWGEQALALARSEDKPILLSIGYAACHWCHVMAHESFEDEQVANVMNDSFVNIKVDREERPDIDYIYQISHQLMSGRSGGWPLTVFMTPEQIPFFVGTYFPPSAGRGMPSFRQVLVAMSEVWKTRREDILKQNQSVLGALQSIDAKNSGTTPLDKELVSDGAAHIATEIDPVKGGFKGAPKFANPTALEFLLSHSSSEKPGNPLKNIVNTLDIMGNSGLFDHIGGGFYRYCVDEDWAVPHFEKMLYDNGLMLSLYSRAFELTGQKRYREWIELTAEWAMREMQDPEGNFYSSLDADSEGEEGRFYVWEKGEIAQVLDSDELRIANELFGLSEEPNFEGRYHLSAKRTYAEVAERCMGRQGEEEVAKVAAAIREKLLRKRGRRTRPGLDDKSLASWNALMISGLYRAARALNDERLEQSASKALGFVRDRMTNGGEIFASYRNGVAYLDGYLNDYAYLLIASLDSMLGANPPGYAEEMAKELAERIVENFSDTKRGGFYFTSDAHEELIIRFRTGMDDVMPSGNAMAALGLYRLGKSIGEERYLQVSRRCIESFSGVMRDYPKGMAGMLEALAEHLHDE